MTAERAKTLHERRIQWLLLAMQVLRVAVGVETGRPRRKVRLDGGEDAIADAWVRHLVPAHLAVSKLLVAELVFPPPINVAEQVRVPPHVHIHRPHLGLHRRFPQEGRGLWHGQIRGVLRGHLFEERQRVLLPRSVLARVKLHDTREKRCLHHEVYQLILALCVVLPQGVHAAGDLPRPECHLRPEVLRPGLAKWHLDGQTSLDRREGIPEILGILVGRIGPIEQVRDDHQLLELGLGQRPWVRAALDAGQAARRKVLILVTLCLGGPRVALAADLQRAEAARRRPVTDVVLRQSHGGLLCYTAADCGASCEQRGGDPSRRHWC
mmetsp:Transcript_69540/g.201864  ORF Transcript_69540/g.201864 Transcript_69540/m.201864 type:complete len:324 (-) Transcript_69540:105-1076(-)